MTINIEGNLLDFDVPKVMGILNLTPDSFYDGGELDNLGSVLDKASKMLSEGADFLDVGGYSSRPNAINISENEELKRITKPLEAIKKNFPQAILSIDTFRAKVAERALEIGVQMVNDISAGDDDPKMFDLIKKYQCPYIIMHKKGKPENMQYNPEYKDVTLEVMKYLHNKIKQLHCIGINDIIIDVGFGFGKTLENNYQLLDKLNFFKDLDTPILVGVSRKSMIFNLLKNTPKEAINGTTIINTIALQKGANILRVHDVKEAKEIIKILEFKKLANSIKQ